MVDLTNFVLSFFLYSILGWMLEVTYSSFLNRKLTNRGFLLGPFCPIYGVGSIIILITSNVITSMFPSKSLVSSVIILMLSITLVTILEYIAGYIQEKAFGTILWDYSKESFNLHGRICLKYSLLWGCLALMLLTVIHTPIERHFLQIRFDIKSTFSIFFIIYMLVDICLSVRKHLKWKKNYSPTTQ